MISYCEINSQTFITKLCTSIFILCLVSTISSPIFAQLANSNFGLRSKMGVTLNHEFNSANFDYKDDRLKVEQQITNFQASFPLLLKIDTSSSKVKLNILKAEYTFRNVENIFNDGQEMALSSTLIREDFQAHSFALSYLHTIGYPWMMIHSLRGTYAGDFGNNNPLNINASSFVLYRVNDKLILGAGVLYQNIEDEHGFLAVPYMDWRFSKDWFVNITAPDRVLVGRDLGRKKRSQLAWGTYLEFFTRFAFQQDGQNRLYENFEISSGIDFRTVLKGKLYLNAFVGNNFYRNIGIKDNNLGRIENVSTFSGLNVRLGLSLNLEGQ